MYLERLISNRIFKKSGRISRPIVKIATLGIILGVAVMLVSLSILIGFREQIQNKIIGFGSHIQISKISSTQNAEADKIQLDQSLLQDINGLDFVNHIQIYATKGALIESEEGLEGVVVKGVDQNYDWGFIDEHLLEGRILAFNDSMPSNEMLISKSLTAKLDFNLNDKASVYFINSREDFRTRKLKIVGIFSTDLSEFDNQQIISDIKHIRKINNWGLSANLLIRDSLDKGLFVKANAFGGDLLHKFSWNNGLSGPGPHYIKSTTDSLIYVVVNDESNTLADTAYLSIVTSPNGSDYSYRQGKGSYDNYIGGYEVLLNDISGLNSKQYDIETMLNYELVSNNYEDLNRELFSWLEMIGVNASIIIVLMIVVAIINMTSTIIIIILERTQLIGLMKAMGSSDWTIRKIFLINSSKMILKGILWGNAIAISLLLAQKYFSLIKLNAESYSLAEVPVGLRWDYFILMDVAVFLICILFLIIPSWIITRLSPVKALRFN